MLFSDGCQLPTSWLMWIFFGQLDNYVYFKKIFLEHFAAILLGGMSNDRSTRPNLVPLLATRCLHGGKSDQRSAWPKFDQMSSWPKVVQLLATICLYWGHLTKGQPDTQIWQKCQPDPKPHLWGVHLTKCHPTQSSIKPGHKMY